MVLNKCPFSGTGRCTNLLKICWGGREGNQEKSQELFLFCLSLAISLLRTCTWGTNKSSTWGLRGTSGCCTRTGCQNEPCGPLLVLDSCIVADLVFPPCQAFLARQ